MSHTLHREGDTESLSKDYVVLTMPCQGRTVEGSEEKLRYFMDTARKYHPVNIGNSKVDNVFNISYEEIRSRTKDGDICHAVFTSPEDLTGFLQELKAADNGLSVVVSGLMDAVGECCYKAGMTPHTVNMSLGIFGKREKLVPDARREVTTMCGHGMVPGELVLEKIEAIRKGRKTPEKAAAELTKLCVCGIFNPVRCAELLKSMAETQKRER